jgi:hypothetical protein
MEALHFSETLDCCYTRRHHMPKDDTPYSHCCQKLKSHNSKFNSIDICMLCHKRKSRYWRYFSILKILTWGRISGWMAGLVTSRTWRLDTKSSAATSLLISAEASVATRILFYTDMSFTAKPSRVQEYTVLRLLFEIKNMHSGRFIGFWPLPNWAEWRVHYWHAGTNTANSITPLTALWKWRFKEGREMGLICEQKKVCADITEGRTQSHLHESSILSQH